MNEIVNNFSLASDKFIPGMNLRGSLDLLIVLIYLLLEAQTFKQTGDSKYSYQLELDKVYFQHKMFYEDLKHLPRRIIADKVLRDKAFNIAKKFRNIMNIIYSCFKTL